MVENYFYETYQKLPLKFSSFKTSKGAPKDGGNLKKCKKIGK